MIIVIKKRYKLEELVFRSFLSNLTSKSFGIAVSKTRLSSYVSWIVKEKYMGIWLKLEVNFGRFECMSKTYIVQRKYGHNALM
jgi:hypothetical protein